MPGSESAPLRVLHALAVSQPHLNGYTVRSRHLVEAQRRSGRYAPTVITSPFYPGNPAAVGNVRYGEVVHLRVPHPVDCSAETWEDRLARLLYQLRRTSLVTAARRGWNRLGAKVLPAPARTRRSAAGGETTSEAGSSHPGRAIGRRIRIRLTAGATRLAALTERSLPWRLVRWLAEEVEERLLMRRFRRHIIAVAADTNAQLIHAHSPYRTALPAIAAAHSLGLPVVYEVRGAWEESAVTSGRFTPGGLRYRSWRRKETRAMRAADAVVCICDTLRDEVLRRGVSPDRVFVVPNAVDERLLRADAETPAAPAGLARAQGQLEGTVLGYVGSIRQLEGVDELVRGVAELARRGREVSLLVVGGGEVSALEALAQELGIGERAVFTGPIGHEEVKPYYQRIDLFVISRPDQPVTRMVTPLKPLEAMALGCPVIASDLPALGELVRHGETGLLYRAGNIGELADALERLIEDPGLAADLAVAARRWVAAQRTWDLVIEGLPEAYEVSLQRQRPRLWRPRLPRLRTNADRGLTNGFGP